MIATKDKPLTALQAAFVQYYADPGSKTYNNAKQSALKAGYAETSADNGIMDLLGNLGVMQAVSGYKVEISAELRWEHEDNLRHQYRQITRYNALLDKNPDNLQALQGLNQVLRELNASNGQHSSTIFDGNEPPPKPITDEERTMLQAMSARLRVLRATQSDEQPQLVLDSAEITQGGAFEKAKPPSGAGGETVTTSQPKYTDISNTGQNLSKGKE